MSDFLNHPAAMPVLFALCVFAFWADREMDNQFRDPVASSHWEIQTK